MNDRSMKDKVFQTMFGSLLTGGAWARLTLWAKQREDRLIEIRVHYDHKGAEFQCVIREGDSVIHEGKGPDLQGLLAMAVLSLGKAF